jgi:hypothetical protein
MAYRRTGSISSTAARAPAKSPATPMSSATHTAYNPSPTVSSAVTTFSTANAVARNCCAVPGCTWC